MSGEPLATPSTYNWAESGNAPPDTLALTATVPRAYEPLGGRVIETAGGPTPIENDTAAVVLVFPAMSVATAVNRCAPDVSPERLNVDE